MRISTALKTIAATGVLASAACSTPTPEPEGGFRIDSQNNVNPTLNTVRVVDGTLARYVGRKYAVNSVLDVERVLVTPSGTGYPRVTAELRNKTGVMIPLEVRTHWYDPAGRPVDNPTSWTRLMAQPMSMVLYEQVSISPAASQYYVEVRGAE